MNKQLLRLTLILFVFSFASAYAQNDTGSTTETQNNSSSEKVSEPINSAFSIRLGEQFESNMVARIIDQQQHGYPPGSNANKLQGTLFNVVPTKPDTRFNSYAVKTTDKGLIYAIQAEYQYEVERTQGKKMGRVKNAKALRSTCKKAVKALADEMQARYGKPRGQGWEGEWFSFRQISDTADISLRLYANQCRTGKYRINLTDEKVKKGILP